MTDDRNRAEKALAALAADQAASWPPVAERFRTARQGRGLTEAQVAERAGLPSASEYWDLELRDDEAFTCVSVEELHSIGAVLGTTASRLLFGEEVPSADGADLANISARLAERIKAEHTTPEGLGERIGWDIVEVLQNPGALATFNIVGFRDLCRAADVSWIEALLAAGSRPPNKEMQRTKHG